MVGIGGGGGGDFGGGGGGGIGGSVDGSCLRVDPKTSRKT